MTKLKNRIITAIALVALVAAVGVTTVPIVTTQVAQADKSADHYSRGFSDGCNGVVVPGPHTSDYQSGYAAGAAKCNGSESSGVGSSSGSASSSGSSSESNGNRLDININR
jgi:hypothetical protein